MHPDPYHEAAFVCILLMCDNDKCRNVLESDELEGRPHYPDEGWIEALGDEARVRGWHIEFSDSDFQILCPSCAVDRLAK